MLRHLGVLDSESSLRRALFQGSLRPVSNRYFRREWDELRSGDHAAWGTATFLFETDDNLVALRQVELYGSGQRLRYDAALPEDEHGFLSCGRIFPEDEWPELFEITAREFEAEWSKGTSA